jgi:iron complex transport system ATP-binding protein
VFTDQRLAASGLSIGYKKPLAENLSFEIFGGELLCLIGPNGSGKSTFLKTIAGLLKPLAGQISVLEKNILKMNANEFAKLVAFVPANFPAETNIRVFDFVALGRSPHTNAFGKLEKSDIDKINSAMEQTESLEFAKFRVSSLSDGEKQRAALARAIAQDAKILLMDEPTAFLDYQRRIKLFEFLKQAAREKGIAVMLSTHELDFAEKYADKILQFG